MAGLIAPHGGTLKSLVVNESRAKELKAASREWPSIDLDPRQLCDLELLLNGGFSPLGGYMTKADYEGVRDSMKLKDGTIWPIPIVLDVKEEIPAGKSVALRDPEGVMIAALHVEEVWKPDREAEAQAVFATTNKEHPGAGHLLGRTQPFYVGGKIEGLQLPVHYDYRPLRHTPAQLRAEFEKLGWSKVVAFQTRNPMHRAHQELTLRAAKGVGAKVLIHPVVGMTKPGDVDHYTRVRCYQALLPSYPKGDVMLSLLPLAMRMGGPREAIWHAIIRKNYGCNHLIVGRDHAGPGKDSSGKPFYGPYDAQELVTKHEKELGVKMVPFKAMVYLEEKKTYVPMDEVPKGAKTAEISGTDLRKMLTEGRDLPEWFTFPAVAEELRHRSPARRKQGLTVFFTGLPSSGKSTVANVMLVKLLEAGERTVTILDGDLVRKNLSKGLGFTREDRDTNIRRIGWVAAEIARHGGTAVCCPIAPYDETRKDVRAMTREAGGGFVLVHVSTPVAECEKRDRKGLYAKARAGTIKEFTGVSDPYEEPKDAEVVIDTTSITPEAAADNVLAYLKEQGYL